jgi:heptosyltransferase-2
MPKFLIIRFSSIGDIVLTTPVIRCLKNQVSGAEVHYLTKKNFAAILQANPYIDRIHLLEDDLNDTIRLLKKQNFDYIIDLHHNLRTLRVKAGLRVKSFSFDKLNIEKWAMTALKVNRLPAIHIVDRYLDTIVDFGVSNDGKGLDYFIPEKDLVPNSNLPKTHQLGFIGMVIGAALATKQLPYEKLLQLCRNLSPNPVILLGGTAEKELGDKIASGLPHVWNACGIFNLNQSADIIRKSTVVISHDTGLMHIAAAFQKPVLSIWGNTIPQFGMGPYLGMNASIDSRIFEVKTLKCRPCSKIGYKNCPKGHFKCMVEQDINAISDHCLHILNNPNMNIF